MPVTWPPPRSTVVSDLSTSSSCPLVRSIDDRLRAARRGRGARSSRRRSCRGRRGAPAGERSAMPTELARRRAPDGAGCGRGTGGGAGGRPAASGLASMRCRARARSPGPATGCESWSYDTGVERHQSMTHDDPIARFAALFARAGDDAPFDHTAMSLGTCGADGQPAVRIVLLHGFDARGFTFYTNYDSRKGQRHRRQRPRRADVLLAVAERAGPRRRDAGADRAGGVGRLLRDARARPAAGRLGVGAEPADRVTRSAAGGRSPRSRRASPAATCRGRRTGAASGSRRRGSSSGRTARSACTTAFVYVRERDAWTVTRLSP